jgi:hypothetical protein
MGFSACQTKLAGESLSPGKTMIVAAGFAVMTLCFIVVITRL